VSLYRRNGIFWYDFEYEGQRYRGSTKLRNERLAQKYVDALRTNLALGKVGLAERPASPTLRQFQKQFLELVNSNHDGYERTREFYQTSYEKLLVYTPYGILS
jgi:hypothetical protein